MKKKFKISWSSCLDTRVGTREVEGDIVGHFGIHRNIDTHMDFRFQIRSPWRISHLPTGLRVADFMKRKTALDAASALADLPGLDWSQSEKKYWEEHREKGEAAKAVCMKFKEGEE